MIHLKRILLFALVAFIMHSCVLEERIHFNEDLSGQYEMSFAIESFDEGEEEGGLSDDFKYQIDSIANEINSINGVELTFQEVTSDGFNLSMNFKDLDALNLINTKSDDQKGVGQFELRDNKLQFSMNTDLNFMDLDGVSPDENKKIDRDDGLWVKHRVIITFDKKIKRLKSNGFKKIDKNTLVYDSEKMIDKKNISFSIKYN